MTIKLITLWSFFFCMHQLPYIFSILRNKYLVALVFFVVWIFFFDRNDLVTQWERKGELEKLEKSAAYYEAEIIAAKKELAELQYNPSALEKFARENFYLKRPEEQVFIVVEESSEKNMAGEQ